MNEQIKQWHDMIKVTGIKREDVIFGTLPMIEGIQQVLSECFVELNTLPSKTQGTQKLALSLFAALTYLDQTKITLLSTHLQLNDWGKTIEQVIDEAKAQEQREQRPTSAPANVQQGDAP